MLISSCRTFASAALVWGELDYPAGSWIIHRKLRQQSESVLSCYPGVGC